MEGMEAYPRAAVERAMKVQEVMLRAMARKITWYQAAEILGMTDRHLRRWRERYEQFGFDGVLDRRRRRPSGKRGRGGTAPAGAAARHAAAHRGQPAPVVSGRALARPAGDSGRCYQRDLLRAVGGGRIDSDGDGRAARGD